MLFTYSIHPSRTKCSVRHRKGNKSQLLVVLGGEKESNQPTILLRQDSFDWLVGVRKKRRISIAVSHMVNFGRSGCTRSSIMKIGVNLHNAVPMTTRR